MSKIQFTRLDLLSKLKLAIQFVPKKTVIPACDEFLFKVKGLQVSITATDLEKSITVTCEALKSDGDISFCLPARLALRTLDLMLGEEVLFTYKSDKQLVEIKCGKSKYKITGTDPATFPVMESTKHEYEASFTGSSFNEAIETASKYADAENTVDSLRGICFRLIDNKINVYGATRNSLGKISVSPRSINSWEDILIPASAIKAINKCISDGDIVDVFHNKGNLEIKTNDVTIVLRAIDCKYPDVDKIFEQKKDNVVELNTLQVLHALERLDLYSPEEEPLMVINITGNILTLKAENTAYNKEGEDEIDVVSQLDLNVGCNVKFFINILQSFTNDSFKLIYSEGKAPIFIEPVNNIVDNDKFFLLMPMNIL